ncbi:type VII secretion-associated serine protease mycosin [Pseudonocardia sp. MH-G8]|uniref:type VII secretion-associated serine protease mycosin n=1 Tax=Pseudonocardia sp. MH-G8 TaxID=1854588 RepID=UPI00117A62EF|nr:type VII secretion-associated serine protease mycosin [Pseudonocardia sp. MH-G8]
MIVARSGSRPRRGRSGGPRIDHRRVGVAVGLAALVLATAAPPAVAGPGGPPATVTDGASALPEPPGPPPVRGIPPAGRPPTAADGLRAPARCTPPRADTPPTAVAAGAGGLPPAAVHRLATGRGQLVAVIDTGVAPHPLLGPRLRGGGDYLTGGDGLDDCDGHGTAVAGLVAAAAPPDEHSGPPIGIAPDAGLLAIRQSSPSFDVPAPDGSRRPAGDTNTLADAVVLAVRAGADVVNISEAVCLPAQRAAEAGAALHTALRFAARADVVVVAAAGNIGTGSCAMDVPGQVALPGWFDHDVLTVGAVTPTDAPAPFTMPGPWVDVAAPGTGLRSLAVGGGTVGGLDGTSFAAPWVAGVAALVRERFPELTAAQVVDRILATARPHPDRSDALGHGVVDPLAALTTLPARLTPAPPPEAAAGAVMAALPGTDPRSDSPAPALRPVGLLAAGALLAAAGLTAAVLRRRARPG